MAAAIERITLDDMSPGLGSIGKGVLEDVKGRVLDEAKRAGWRWYRANEDRVLLSKWFLKLRVKDLRFVFVELFGPEPASA